MAKEELQDEEGVIEFDFDFEEVEETAGGDDGSFQVEMKDDAPADLTASTSPTTVEKKTEVVEPEGGTFEVEFNDNAPASEESDGTFDVEMKDDIAAADSDGGNGEAAKDNTPSSLSAPSSPSFVKDFASALEKDGYLSELDEETLKAIEADPVAGLAKAVENTIKKNEFSGLDDRGKTVLQAIRDGVPVENIARHQNAQLKLNSIKEEMFVDADNDDDTVASQKENMRKQLIYNDNLARGYSEDVAKRKTESSFKAGEDEDDARLAMTNLAETAKKNEQAEYAQAASDRESAQTRLKNFRSEVTKMEEIFPGIPVAEDVRNKIADNVTIPTGKNEKGGFRTVVTDKRAENPNQFDVRLNYLIEMGLFEDKPDLSLFTNRSMTSAVKELSSKLGTEGMYDEGRGVSLSSVAEKEQQNELFDILDGMEDI